MNKKLGGWERLVILLGILVSLPVVGFLGLGIYSIATGLTDSYLSILWPVVGFAFIWSNIGALLWVIDGFKNND